MATESKSGAKPGPVVLVVDDDAAILRVVQLALERTGYTVKTAPDGEQALQMLGQMRPDVLILDVVLPGISGFDVCQAIKRNERLASVPVLFLTGQDSPQDFKAAMASGATMYMTKPFKPERLLQAVNLLSRRESGEAPLPAKPSA